MLNGMALEIDFARELPGTAKRTKKTMNILLATHHLETWSGSELVTLELAEFFRHKGHQVDVWAAHKNDDFIGRIDFDGINLLNDDSHLGRIDRYGIIYSHHSMTTLSLGDSIRAILNSKAPPVFIFNHLSPYEPFERPSTMSETMLADCILANSPETASALQAFGRRYKSTQVMPNPAPPEFEGARRARTAGRLKRLLIVSNHVPAEVTEAIKRLRSDGVDVKCIGLPDARRVVPNDLRDADAVLTIGKTVQYAIRASCPVYNYDHFAGPGWLTESNFSGAENVNFSGRDNRNKKTPLQLADELKDVPEAALAAVANCPRRFKLEYWAEMFLDLHEKPRKPKGPQRPSDRDYIRSLVAVERNVHSHIDQLYKKVERYRVAYQTSANAIAEYAAAADRLHTAYLDETAKAEALRTEVQGYHNAYREEAAKSDSLRVEAQEHHQAYVEEQAKTEGLMKQSREFYDAYLIEAARSETLMGEAHEYRQAYLDETAKTAALRNEVHEFRHAYIQESMKLAELKKETLEIRNAYLEEVANVNCLKDENERMRREKENSLSFRIAKFVENAIHFRRQNPRHGDQQ